MTRRAKRVPGRKEVVAVKGRPEEDRVGLIVIGVTGQEGLMFLFNAAKNLLYIGWADRRRPGECREL